EAMQWAQHLVGLPTFPDRFSVVAGKFSAALPATLFNNAGQHVAHLGGKTGVDHSSGTGLSCGNAE
ncbi:MAG: hypothetical protein WD065_10585, partial [Planctomycetaceae bacterium]